MKDDNQKEPSTFWVTCGVIIALALVIWTIVELITGIASFILSGGWKWILVILGLFILSSGLTRDH